MANFFDQFDAPSGNFFDQFDAPKPKPANDAPPIGQEISGGVMDSLKSAGKSVADYLNPFSEARHQSYAKQANAPIGEALVENLKQIGGTGKALAAPILAPGEAAGAIATPLLAHPWQGLNKAIGIDLPYEQAKEQAGTALMGVAPRGFSPMGARPILAPPPAPSIENLETAASADYNHPSVTSLQIHPQAAVALKNTIDTELLNNRVDRYVAPTVSGVIDRLEQPRFGPTTTVADLDLARQALSDVPHNETRAASIAKGVIDDYMGNIPQADLLAGDAQAANQFLTQGRGNWAAAQRARDIDRALHNADVNAGSTYAGGNLNNATRQQLRPLLKMRKGQRNLNLPGWNNDEMAQLANAVRGTTTGNVARAIGKAGPSGGLMGFGHAAAAYGSGGATVPLSVATVAAQLVGNASTARQAAKLSELLRSRSPLAQAAASAPRTAQLTNKQRIIAALLAARGNQAPSFAGLMPAYADQNQ